MRFYTTQFHFSELDRIYFSLVFQSDFKIFAKKTITHAMQHIFSTEFVGSSYIYTYMETPKQIDLFAINCKQQCSTGMHHNKLYYSFVFHKLF